MRRKRFQRGSLTTRIREGKKYWLGQWRENGRHKTRELGICSKVTRLVAESLLQQILVPVNDGTHRDKKGEITFERFVEFEYLPLFRQKWKLSTADTETSSIRHHLNRSLGNKLMSEIDRSDMQRVLDRTARTCGKSTVNHLRFRLRSIFELAVSEAVVQRNPAISLFTPKHTKSGRARKVLAPDELESMLDVLPLREQIIVRLATWEGMRPGEILALQFGDLEGDSIRVRRRLYRGNIDSPKNERSSRQVALTEGTKALLAQWAASTNSGKTEPWLFPSENGQPIRRDNVWRRYIWPKLNPLGFAWATFQVMRRTYATWSKDNGVDAHTRSAQMGNTVDVNENEYAVASLKQKLAAVRKVETAVAKQRRGADSETNGSEVEAAKKIKGW